MRKVEVSTYKEQWALMFEAEAEQLRGILGLQLIDIYHIGSTSISGLKAKPIIDIMPVVRDIELVDEYNQSMREIGYEPKGENGIVGRRYFEKGGDNRTHHVHIYEIGSPEIERHLAFRDFLMTHPARVVEYGELKGHLAQQFPYDIESYINGKERLVSEIDRKALQWYRENKKNI